MFWENILRSFGNESVLNEFNLSYNIKMQFFVIKTESYISRKHSRKVALIFFCKNRLQDSLNCKTSDVYKYKPSTL